jgi:tRNA(fMet)-specific endonuclease VapC
MSAITFAELMNGAKKSQRVEANVSRLNALGEILEICSFDKQAAIVYGDVRSSLEKRGEVIGPHDLLIAAHALSLDRTLITNNEREFKRVEGLKIDNWAVDG